MASKKHLFIISCLARKMREKGYEIVAFDGKWQNIGLVKLKMPFQITRHRPDIIGIKPNTSKVCVGEGKTSNDLHTQRTKEQIKDFADAEGCELIIGAPKSCEKKLLDLLSEMKLEQKKNISYILIPEELMPNGKI